METVNNYNVFEWCSSQPSSMEEIERWNQKVIKFLLEALENSTANIFTLNPDKARSIGYDLGNQHEEGKFNSIKYLCSTLTGDLTREISTLVGTDEFYLGYIILVKGALSKKMIQDIIIFWEGNLVLAGVELFKMGSDGLCVYWYNTSSLSIAQQTLARISA